MSQINCLPRPAFWKVPDYINNMDDNRDVIYQQQVLQQPQQQQIHTTPMPRKSSLTLYRGSRPHGEKIKKRVRFKDFDENDHHQYNYQNDYSQQPLHYNNQTKLNNVRIIFYFLYSFMFI